MAYHPLANDTDSTPDDRRAEARRIIKMLNDAGVVGSMLPKEESFVCQMDDGDVSPKQLFWLRDILSKYLWWRAR